jgi:hypothetical protein
MIPVKKGGCVMYCNYCGSKKCFYSELGCIFSLQTLKILVPFLEKNFINKSRFNKIYSMVPLESWDKWAIANNLPTIEILRELYPEEDLESILFLVLDGNTNRLSPELRSYYTEQSEVEYEESLAFSEFRTFFTINGLTALTKDYIMNFNLEELNKIPRPIELDCLKMEVV